ncbi:MAG: hypothetical protein NDI61_00130 [Bdellovibrionaceae bacterium]|nr:hypothetical protein [Pseudobdellovibrionaceae bacterium]
MKRYLFFLLCPLLLLSFVVPAQATDDFSESMAYTGLSLARAGTLQNFLLTTDLSVDAKADLLRQIQRKKWADADLSGVRVELESKDGQRVAQFYLNSEKSVLIKSNDRSLWIHHTRLDRRAYQSPETLFSEIEKLAANKTADHLILEMLVPRANALVPAAAVAGVVLAGDLIWGLNDGKSILKQLYQNVTVLNGIKREEFLIGTMQVSTLKCGQFRTKNGLSSRPTTVVISHHGKGLDGKHLRGGRYDFTYNAEGVLTSFSKLDCVTQRLVNGSYQNTGRSCPYGAPDEQSFDDRVESTMGASILMKQCELDPKLEKFKAAQVAWKSAEAKKQRDLREKENLAALEKARGEQPVVGSEKPVSSQSSSVD